MEYLPYIGVGCLVVAWLIDNPDYVYGAFIGTGLGLILSPFM